MKISLIKKYKSWLYSLLIILGPVLGLITKHFDVRAIRAQGPEQNTVLDEKLVPISNPLTLESLVKFVSASDLQDSYKSNLPKSEDDPPQNVVVVSGSVVGVSGTTSFFATPAQFTQPDLTRSHDYKGDRYYSNIIR